MKLYKIIFSPTGGTKKVTDSLANAMEAEVEEIDLSQSDFNGCSLTGDGIALIAIPSFGGRAPKTAMDRLKLVQGNGMDAVVIAVYGNREQEDTLLEIADAAKEQGFRVIAGVEAIAEHSIAHKYAAGRPDKADADQLASFGTKILERREHHPEGEPAIPGNRPYKKAGAGMIPKAQSSCVECGLCASKCPVGAIPKESPRLTDKTKCIGCMRCVSLCPQGARTIGAVKVKLVETMLKKACSARKDNKLYLA